MFHNASTVRSDKLRNACEAMPDVGEQYRSGIWYVNDQQRQEAEAFIKKLEAQNRDSSRKIVTQLEPAQTFWPAEEYHQDYIVKTGRACHVKDPW